MCFILPMLNHSGISKLNHISYSQLRQRRAELSRTPLQGPEADAGLVPGADGGATTCWQWPA